MRKKSAGFRQIGSPWQIYKEPHSSFVADFVGTSNFITAVRDNDKIDKIRFGKLQLSVAGLNRVEGNTLYLAIRPENIEITSPDKGKAKGKLTMVSALGSEYLAYINIEGVEIIARSFDKINIKEGENVGINFHEKHLYFFDNKSGSRIKTPVDS